MKVVATELLAHLVCSGPRKFILLGVGTGDFRKKIRYNHVIFGEHENHGHWRIRRSYFQVAYNLNVLTVSQAEELLHSLSEIPDNSVTCGDTYPKLVFISKITS